MTSLGVLVLRRLPCWSSARVRKISRTSVMADYGDSDVAQMRKPYYTSKKTFTANDLVSGNPMKQFDEWFKYASAQEDIPEPNAMTIATVDSAGRPSARMVLLKGYGEEGFRFFTNFDSRKGKELASNPNVALVLYWGPINRSVRVEGVAEKLSDSESDKYFATRPRRSQIAAHVSTPQSSPVYSRDALEEAEKAIVEKYKNSDIPRPDFWGGYVIRPHTIEFWQGQSNRMHDRLRFRQKTSSDDLAIPNSPVQQGEDGWVYERLFP